jgi:hypothetical protein
MANKSNSRKIEAKMWLKSNSKVLSIINILKGIIPITTINVEKKIIGDIRSLLFINSESFNSA